MQCPIIKSSPLQHDSGFSFLKNVSCIYCFKNAKKSFFKPKNSTHNLNFEIYVQFINLSDEYYCHKYILYVQVLKKKLDFKNLTNLNLKN
jgi:hypothetical protein